MEKSIKCPNCGTEFKIDESNYNELLQTVRNEEFEKELQRREQDLKKIQDSQIQTIKLEQAQKNEAEVNRLNKQIDDLKHRLENSDAAKAIELSQTKESYVDQINKLQLQLAGINDKIESEVNKAIIEKEKEIVSLNEKISSAKKDQELALKAMEEKFKVELQNKDDLLNYYKDLKTKMSTKMVGETLEQHCEIQFNTIRQAGFKNAYFEKDNKVSSTGSKGDYIFKDYTDDGVEFISIMFEMKNEMDTTATKHKNEDFLKELDKDRNEKGCEYAVLVSLLENGNEYYDQGIVDVSYRYPKMYVIRPQFFIPLITLLRNAALNSVEAKKELVAVRAQNVDIVNFETNLENFKLAIGNNYRLAGEKFKDAIDNIDKTIRQLQKVKEELEGSINNLRLANNKAEGITIKKLTKDCPTVQQMFDAIDNDKK